MTPIKLNEISAATHQAAFAVASGWSEAAARYSAWVAAASAEDLANETKRFNAFARELGSSYQAAANKALIWAQAARDAGNNGIGEIMDRYANKYIDQADRLLNSAFDKKASLNLLAAEAKVAMQSADDLLGGTFGRALGPTFD